MAREAWQRTITDAAGNVLTGVQITVFQADGVTPATIYGQLTGGSALANPFSTGVQTSAKFYADPGRYVIRAFKDGLTQEFTDVDIGGKAVRDDIGTAAYLAATTSRTDATLGRAAKVGDHGLGVALEGVDIRALPVSAFYTGSSGIQVTGSPDNGFGFGLKVCHTSQGQNYYASMYRAHDVERWFVTGSYGQGPQPWRELYHNANVLGPVAFSGGVNTGAILEYGSNSNGEFLKMADGTALAWGRVIQTGLSISPTKSGNSNTAYPCNPTLPLSLLSGVAISIGQRAFYDASNDLIYSVLGAGANGYPLMFNLGTKPSDLWPALDVIGTSVAVKADYFWSAIGRWR